MPLARRISHNGPVDRARRERGRFFSVALGVAAAALLGGAAPASAAGRGDPSAGHLPGHDDVSVPHRCDHDLPGPEHEPLRTDEDLPERDEGQRARRHERLRSGLDGRGLRDPLQAEHGRAPPRRLDDHAERLGPAPAPRRLDRPGRADLRLRRGEDDRDEPQGYGLKVGGDDRWGLNYMLHSLNADSGRQVYVTWEIDWVPETDPPRTDIQTTRVQWMDVAGLPHIYPVFDAERGFDLNGDGKYVFPDEVPTDPNVAGLRGAREHQPAEQVDRAGGRARRSSSAAATCTPAASTSTFRSRATGPTPARSTATTRARSDRCSGPTPSTTSPPAR